MSRTLNPSLQGPESISLTTIHVNHNQTSKTSQGEIILTMKLGDHASVDCNGEQEKNCLKYIRVKEGHLSSLSGFHTTSQHGLELISFFGITWTTLLCFSERTAGESPWVSYDALIIFEALENIPIFPI